MKRSFIMMNKLSLLSAFLLASQCEAWFSFTNLLYHVHICHHKGPICPPPHCHGPHPPHVCHAGSGGSGGGGGSNNDASNGGAGNNNDASNGGASNNFDNGDNNADYGGYESDGSYSGSGSYNADGSYNGNYFNGDQNAAYTNDNGLEEFHQCIRSDSNSVQYTLSLGYSDKDCQSLSCGGGCCRYHSVRLVCDTDNTYSHLPCVCNELTDNDWYMSSSQESVMDRFGNLLFYLVPAVVVAALFAMVMRNRSNAKASDDHQLKGSLNKRIKLFTRNTPAVGDPNDASAYRLEEEELSA